MIILDEYLLKVEDYKKQAKDLASAMKTDALKKRLEIDFSTSDDYQSIRIKNSIDSSVLETNPDLDSTKKDKVNHGLGTKIIRDITEKYEGICSFFEKNGMFGVHVMIPIRREE